MEEKKSFDGLVWTEEQWEKWIYSFATEVESGKDKALAPSGETSDGQLLPAAIHL